MAWSSFYGQCAKSPNDLKVSDWGGRRRSCMVGSARSSSCNSPKQFAAPRGLGEVFIE
jgi:hypothetical protein